MKEVISVKGANASTYEENGVGGGEVNINLARSNGDVVISGSHQATISPEDDIIIDASGGDGAQGEIAPPAKQGLTGIPGTDACFYQQGEQIYYSRGGTGGRGCLGQPAIDGTDGSAAGPGGNVTITVREEDLGLLDILEEVNIKPGVPGKKGKNGEPGTGGEGGPGGRGATYWQPYKVIVSGYRIGYMASAPFEREETRYRCYEAPGGVKGPIGPRGKKSKKVLSDGAEASSGIVKYRVKSMNAFKTYESMFQLKLSPARITSEGDIFCINFDVENTSQDMPSPKCDNPYALKIAENPFFEIIEEGKVEGNIQGNSFKYSLLPLKLRYTGDKFQDAEVSVQLFNPVLNRPFRNSDCRFTLFKAPVASEKSDDNAPSLETKFGS